MPSREQRISEMKDLADRLLSGPEAFLVWADIVSVDKAREILSKHAPYILQAIPSIVESINQDQYNDVRARLLLTLGKLCLDYNMMTHSCTKACLNIALRDFGKIVANSLSDTRPKMKNRPSPMSSAVRLSVAFGILVAKLSTRLKYSKEYADIDPDAELAEAEKLKKM